MKKTKDGFIFSSGRTLYAHAHIIGIDPELTLSYGYDGSIDWPIPDWWTEEEKKDRLTADDMKELAEYMLSLWSSFRATL